MWTSSKILTEQYLIKKYIEEKLSIRKIASQLKIHKTTIYRALKKYNIKRRTISEALKNKCWGKNNSNWKNGRRKSKGYILIYSPTHPYKDINNYVAEHKLVLENYLGRYLKPNEITHHINKIRNDNRIENLILFSSFSAHMRFHYNPKYVKSNEIIFDGRKLKERVKK